MRALDHSNHGPVSGAYPAGVVATNRIYEISVLVRRRVDAPAFPDSQTIGSIPIAKREYPGAEEFAATYGANPKDQDTVRNFLVGNGLMVTKVSVGRRCVWATGTAAQMTQAFQVNLQVMMHSQGAYVGYVGAIHVPDILYGVIVSVIGLDEHPIASPPVHQPTDLSAVPALGAGQMALHLNDKLPGHYKKFQAALNTEPTFKKLADKYDAFTQKAAKSGSAPAAGANVQELRACSQRATDAYAKHLGLYYEHLGQIQTEAARRGALAGLHKLGVKTPPQIAQLYEFPKDTDGSGQTIGIVELGGGYLRSDLEAYFAFLGLPMIDISDVEVSGGANRPSANIFDPVDGEVALDIQVIGGAAPGAKVVVYFAPLHAKGFADAIHAALHDKESRPDVLSISWDLSEGFWLQAPMHVFHLEEVLAEAAMLGVTVLCSAGDYGSQTTFHDGRYWVDYPASSPWSIACGGTTLYSRQNTILWEIVWNTLSKFKQATGGGVSQIFPLPEWQEHAGVPNSLNPGGGRGRGVPDMAGNADPSQGYLVHFHGRTTVIGGTSAVAPLFAAMMARINQSLGKRVGYINPLLYGAKDKSGAFHDIKLWNNGTYSARIGWDPCTGLGRPIGSGLESLLRNTGNSS